MPDVARWLSSLELDCYAQAFASEGIDFDVLPELTDADLQKIGVRALGHRKRILRAIASLAAASGPDAFGAARGRSRLIPAEPGAAAAERRHLTVMFCDLVGYTALAERLDPEDLQCVVAAYHEAVVAAVAPYDGHVAQLLGDGVLVYFGYPRAHEDDAPRAVRAALATVDAVGSLRPGAGIALQARVGIATGMVVVGAVGAGTTAAESLATGETPNLAARLQAAARPGEIVIAAETRRLVGAEFRLESRGGLALKGLSGPVEAWRVLTERPVASRFEARQAQDLVPFVGREGELGLLRQRWALALRGEGQAVLLAGEAGIGKSRICDALRERVVRDAGQTALLQCTPYHGSSALYPVTQYLDWAAGVAGSDTATLRASRLARHLLAVERAGLSPATAGRLLRLVGLPDGGRLGDAGETPQQEKAYTLAAVVELFRALARSAPLLLLVEDVHWVDPTTEELLGDLFDGIRSVPCLLIVTSRLDYEPASALPPHLSRLELGRLGHRQAALLARAVTGARELPDAVIEEIVRRTDGVPLFVEELTKALIETAGTRGEDRADAPTEMVRQWAIPASLQDSLAARLDRLPRSKVVAQIGSVIGREFPLEVLHAVAALEPGDLDDALDELTRAELIVRAGTAPQRVYRFKHALVRDAAYQSLLKSDRLRHHAQIAAAIESLFADRVAEHYDRLGEHYATAEVWDKAADYLSRAGSRAFETAAFDEAAAQFERALRASERMPRDLAADRQRLRILFRLHDALLPLGRYERMRTVLGRAEALAASIGDRLSLARVYSYQSHFAWIAKADNDAGAAYAGRSMALARECGNATLEIATRFYLGQIEYSRGNLRESAEALGAIAAATPVAPGAPRFERFFGVSSRAWSVFPLTDLGRFSDAESVVDEALAAGDRFADTMLRLPAWFGKAHLCWARGDFASGIAVGERFLAEPDVERLFQWYIPIAAIFAGSLLHEGQAGRALRLLEEIARLHQTVGLVAHQSFTLCVLAEAGVSVGRREDAARAAATALRLARQRSEKGFAALARWTAARIALADARPDHAAAREHLRAALQTSRRIGHRVLEVKCLFALGQAQRLAGEPEEALSSFAQSHALASELGMPYWVARASEERNVIG